MRDETKSASPSRSGTPLLPKHTTTHLDIDSSRGRPSNIHSSSTLPKHRSTTRTSPSDGIIHPIGSRRGTMRSQSPSTSAATTTAAARKKYAYATFFLIASLITFTVQTELASYIQHDLGWNKAYCMLWLSHGSWSMLWPFQLLILRLQKWEMPWPVFWRKHVWLLRTTAEMVEAQDLDVINKQKHHQRGKQSSPHSPVPYLLRTTAFTTAALTVAALSWYVAINMTTPSDLTAIYNCSAFFAYAFSVPLLREKLRLDKSIAVGIAVLGVLIVAYGDTKAVKTAPQSPITPGSGSTTTTAEETEATSRFLGNLIIGAGSILYGLYEVLYKRYACPPDGCSPGRGMIFANTFGSLIGSFTLLVFWIPLPLLHYTGIETFVFPRGEIAWYLFLSIVMNATFAGSFLVLISLTSPVLSSVASLLTIFIVAVSDWWITGEMPSVAALGGGLLIVVAFAMLSWSTWREMTADGGGKDGIGEGSDGDALMDSDEESDGDFAHEEAYGQVAGHHRQSD